MYLTMARTGSRLTALGLVSLSGMHVERQESRISGSTTLDMISVQS